jgi:hypothetical protein
LPANFEKSTTTSARSAGASSIECLSTLPKSKRVGSVIQVVGCWPSITAGAGRKPPSLAICTQSGPAASLWASAGVGDTVGSVCAAASSVGFSLTSLWPLPFAGSGSAVYHWKLKNRSFAALSSRIR